MANGKRTSPSKRGGRAPKKESRTERKARELASEGFNIISRGGKTTHFGSR